MNGVSITTGIWALVASIALVIAGTHDIDMPGWLFNVLFGGWLMLVIQHLYRWWSWARGKPGKNGSEVLLVLLTIVTMTLASGRYHYYDRLELERCIGEARARELPDSTCFEQYMAKFDDAR